MALTFATSKPLKFQGFRLVPEVLEFCTALPRAYGQPVRLRLIDSGPLSGESFAFTRIHIMSDVFSSLAPLGIGAVAIASIVLLMRYRGSAHTALSIFALVLILLIYAIEKFNAPQYLTKKADVAAAVPATAPDTSAVDWVDTGTFADWGGRDDAFTKGQIPKYNVNGTILCDDSHVGFVATCWSDRPSGYPPNVTTKKDFTPPPNEPAWCTYKNSDITIVTSPDGSAPKGRVYLCARTVAH